MSLSRFHRIVFLAAVLVHFITAWSSSGYHTADEHFQIIAFAQWKLGDLDAQHLPWEFAERIRCSIQPWIATVVFQLADVAGFVDPFSKTFLLRLLTALVMLFVMRSFVGAVLPSLGEKVQRPFILLSYFLWFLPFLHVRFCSETWASALLLLALTVVIQADERSRWWAAKTGVLLALAICLRPATIPAVGGLVLWAIFIRKAKPRELLSAVLGGGLALALSAIMDTAFYAGPSFSLWHYLDANFPSHPGHVFDSFPWYYYFPWIVKYALPPLGLVMLATFGLFVFRRPEHPITWCTVPLVLALSIVPHKELRFLYPLAALVPLMIMLGWSEVASYFRAPILRKGLVAICALLILLNAAGLAVVLTTPAGSGRTALAQAAHRIAKPGDLIGYVIEPAVAWRIAFPDFYRPPGTEEAAIDRNVPGPLNTELDLLVAQPVEAGPFAQQHGLQLRMLARTATPWAEQLIRWYTWDEGEPQWVLYEVQQDPR